MKIPLQLMAPSIGLMVFQSPNRRTGCLHILGKPFEGSTLKVEKATAPKPPPGMRERELGELGICFVDFDGIRESEEQERTLHTHL